MAFPDLPIDMDEVLKDSKERSDTEQQKEVENSDAVSKSVAMYCNGSEEICAARPQELLDLCERLKKDNCKNMVQEGVDKFCKESRSANYKACDWLATTSSSPLPFIIGGIVGFVVLLAIGIGLFIYCRHKKKKAAGQGQSKTGTMNGGTTVPGTTNTGTNTGTIPTAPTNTAARY